MKIKSIISSLVLILFFVTTSCTDSAVYHKHIMRGTVIETIDGTIYLCVGTHDGAKVGQELTVIRVAKTESLNPRGYPIFKREEVGKVKITEIVDEHMANAKIISGEAKVNDIVELKK